MSSISIGEYLLHCFLSYAHDQLSVTGNSISMDEARDYEHFLQEANETEPIPTPPSVDPPVTDETRVLSFAELQQLIETGKVDQIPNNKVIPEAINVSAVEIISLMLSLLATLRMPRRVSRRHPHERSHGRQKPLMEQKTRHEGQRFETILRYNNLLFMGSSRAVAGVSFI